jgi:hypothetical protein
MVWRLAPVGAKKFSKQAVKDLQFSGDARYYYGGDDLFPMQHVHHQYTDGI